MLKEFNGLRRQVCVGSSWTTMICQKFSFAKGYTTLDFKVRLQDKPTNESSLFLKSLSNVCS